MRRKDLMDNFVRITLRIPTEVHGMAVELAHENERSLNWQIINLIKIGSKKIENEKTLTVAGKH